MANESHLTVLGSHCDPNPAYGLPVPLRIQTSETQSDAGDFVVQTGSSPASVHCQGHRPPVGEVHTVDVNDLQHVYDYAHYTEPPVLPDRPMVRSM